MKVRLQPGKRPRIEMIPLIDCVFLLLVFFIYSMLSMAVHRGLPVALPTSSSARIDKRLVLSVTMRGDGTIYVEKERTALGGLATALEHRAGGREDTGVLLFADRTLPYQELFRVLDQVRKAGLSRISLQAEEEVR